MTTGTTPQLLVEWICRLIGAKIRVEDRCFGHDDSEFITEVDFLPQRFMEYTGYALDII